MLSVVLKDCFAVNFEDELTSIREENANVVGVETTNQSDVNEQKRSRIIH